MCAASAVDERSRLLPLALQVRGHCLGDAKSRAACSLGEATIRILRMPIPHSILKAVRSGTAGSNADSQAFFPVVVVGVGWRVQPISRSLFIREVDAADCRESDEVAQAPFRQL